MTANKAKKQKSQKQFPQKQLPESKQATLPKTPSEVAKSPKDSKDLVSESDGSDMSESPTPSNKIMPPKRTNFKVDEETPVATKPAPKEGCSLKPAALEPELVKQANKFLEILKAMDATMPETQKEVAQLAYQESRRTNELLQDLVAELRKRNERKKHKRSKTLKNDPDPPTATKKPRRNKNDKGAAA